MGYLGWGVTQTLCTIRRPLVWYLELICCTSLENDQDDWGRSSWDHPKRPGDDPEMYDYYSRLPPNAYPSDYAPRYGF